MDTTDLGLKGQLVFEHTLANDAACLVDDRATAGPARAIGLVALFASTLFLSAFLSFAAEPMVAKMVLPILGGAPMLVEPFLTPEEKKASHWSILARSGADLGALNQDPQWIRLIATTSVPLWTDDFSNLVGVLNINER